MKIVIGENSGAEYKISKELGRGGQGRVFAIDRGKYAVKILGKKNSRKSLLLKKQISYIRTRNIKDLPVSMPLEQIRGDFLGYIMEMATDMVPLETLLTPSDKENWWVETGGLKKRLNILMKLADVLSELNSRGLIYGDLSPKNVFVSEDPEFSEVYLIDVDNITHQSKVGKVVYTPGYGAPEVVKVISGADTYTDAYSFSVIAYQLLTLNHPFIGDYVNKGDPGLEEKAYLGELPWINNSGDKLNESFVGFPYTVTVPPLMMKEFKNTFEDHLHNKLSRTSMLKWKEAINKSKDSLVFCEKCHNDFNYVKFRKFACPFCSEKKDYIGVISITSLDFFIKKEIEKEYIIDLNDVPVAGGDIQRFTVEPRKKFIVKEDHVYLNGSKKELFEIEMDYEKFLVKGMAWDKISVCDEQTLKIKKDINIVSGVGIKYSDIFLFSSNSDSSYQRVIRIRKVSQ